MTKSPIDRALENRNKPRQPYPDAQAVKEGQLRAVKQAPLDIQAGALRDDDPASRNAVVALAHLSSTAATLADAARETPYDKLAPAAGRAVETAQRKLDDAANTIRAQIRHYESRRDEAIMPRISDAMGAEIRTLVRTLSPSEVVKLAESDPRVSSAILAAPAALTGLKSPDIERVRSRATAVHATEQAALLKSANRALDVVERAGAWSVTNLSTKVAAWRERAADTSALDALNA